MIDLVIHVGIRKSATTWLQEKLFPELSGIHYLGKTEADYPRWLINWHYLDDFEFARRAPEIRDAAVSAMKTGVCNVISSEAFTNTAATWSQAQRIKQLFPHARILVTLRDPIDTLISHYKLDVVEGTYHLPLEHYLDWERTPYDLVKRKPIYLPDFYYDEMIGLYEALFGAKNVCVLRYEDMMGSPEQYFSELGSFIQTNCSEIAGRNLSVKANAGQTSDAVRRGRAKNLTAMLRAHYPSLDSIADERKVIGDIDGTIMPGDLRTRLKTYFNGRCHGYY